MTNTMVLNGFSEISEKEMLEVDGGLAVLLVVAAGIIGIAKGCTNEANK